ncbi:Transcription elongation factor spt6 [Auxenochlorella protothecoides]|uniref:Transcription elongation factor spt6 n=1 Tax=Auxenochlorella protothecoides TaxID=3075 RepID=A0A087SGV1_AUXPR|nr:Transcription elongation factor spt6 [Auxenochlorella protothecoides]KFM24955.1 Transcription elongation factor spt6 [Auxenochlorella protothecoides]
MSDLLDDRAGVEEVTEKERPAGSEDEDEDEDEDFEDGDETKEGASGQDSSEEEEGPDDYDYDDKFLVREDEDEDGDGAAEGEAQPPAGAAKHAKKKRRHRELVLEDDDYDLLEENTGIRRARPAAHRRIKKARDADRGLGREGGAQALQEELFGAELEVRGRGEFCLDEANDIFGDVSDLLAMYEDRKAAGAREAGEEALDEGAEEVDAEEFSDEEVAEALRLQRRHFLTARDDAIRDADLPERLQLADDPTPRDWDLGACAAWVTARLAEDPGVAGQLVRAGVREVEGPPPAWHGGEAWRAGELEGGLRSTADRRGLYAGHERGEEGAARGLPPGALPALNDAVAAALEEVYHRHREVPTIGMYAKERVAELLVLRRTDEPYFTKEDEASRTYPAGSIQPRDRVIRRWDVLHAVHDLARRWRALARLRAARAAAYEAALASASDADEAAGISQCLERLAEAQDREGVEDVDARFRQLTLRGDAGAPAAPRLDDAGGDAASAARRPRAAQKAGGYDLLRRAGLAAAVPRFAFTSAQLAEYLAQGFVPAGAEPPDPPVSPAEFALEYLAPDLGFASGEAALGGIVRAAAAQLAAEPVVRAHARAHHWRACTLSTFPTPAGEGALEPTHPLALAKRLRGKPLASFAGSDLYARVAAAERAGLVTVSLDVAGGAGALTAALEAVYLSGRLAPVAREWEALRLRDEEVPEGERRVVGAVWGPGTPPTTLVALDPAGALVDWLHCPQWSGAVPRRRGAAGPSDDPFADPRRAGDAARVRAFLEAHDPHLLAVGAGHPEARGLHADLAGVLDSVLVHAPGSRLASGLALVWADERVAAAWEGSAAAHAELPTAAGVALEEAFAEPRHVEALRLSRLAEALAGEGGEGAGPPPGLATLIDIQFEFARPYGELRPKAKRLKEEELFWLCLGETPETLAAGKKVEARVRYVTAGVAFVSLPDLGNIDATIQAGNVSGSHGEVDCRDFMKQGDNLTARIIFLDPAEWRIELSTTSQALNDDAAWEQRLLCSREPYYVPLTLAEKAAAERSRRPAKPAFTPRQIRHPLFENISMNEAAKRLMEEGRPVGSAIFRPSHKGTRNIILSLRMPGGQVWHLDIMEGPKVGALYRTSGFTVNLGRVFFRGVSVAGEEPGVYRNGKGTGQLQLGTPLNMEVIPGKKREVYEELDEVVSRFVEPFGLHCQALQRFRHWRDAAWEAASEELVALKAGVPANQAVYCLGVEPRQPGMFYLGYVLGRTPHREFFMVTHRGFHFRKHDYRTVEHMVNQFKKAPRGDSFTTPGARHAAAQPGAGAEPQQPQPPQQPPQPPAEAVRPHYGAHSYPGASTQAYDYPPYPPQYQYPQAGNPYPAYAAGAGVAPGPPPAVNPAVGYGYAAPAWQPPLPQG